MGAIIENEIKKIIEVAKIRGEVLTEERAFDFLVCALTCYNSLDYNKYWYEIINQNITDGANDGGIDFVFYDDENSKVILGQNKYSKNCDVNGVVSEINKINSTIRNFKNNNTSDYSKILKERYLNVIDRLNDENEGNIEVIFASLSLFNISKVESKVEHNSQYSELLFYGENELEKIIEDLQTELNVVEEFKFDIDQSKNVLEYRSNNFEGSVLNISANSLKKAYDKYESKGLFNLNIRRYIKSKSVDDGIINTINHDKDDFWFRNNGLTIACKDYRLDGNTVKIYDFSIVNGGQTTTLIAKHLKSVTEDFYVMAKIVKSVEELGRSDSMNFFNEIAEATNSQKPIQPRDLKSNSPEMLLLQRLLAERGYFLEIKRGVLAPRRYGDSKIKNEELAQLIYSFVFQKPGTARSNKKSLFSNNTHYKQIFRQKYGKNPNQVDFLIDLIQLNKRVDHAIQKFKNKEAYSILSPNQLNVLNNSKLAIFALMGFIYRIVNNDLKFDSQKIEDSLDYFEYGYFISNYKDDDIDEKIEELIFELVDLLTEWYETELKNENVTSISNFLKTDKNYTQTILEKYISQLKRRKNLNGLIDYFGPLFKR